MKFLFFTIASFALSLSASAQGHSPGTVPTSIKSVAQYNGKKVFIYSPVAEIIYNSLQATEEPSAEVEGWLVKQGNGIRCSRDGNSSQTSCAISLDSRGVTN